MNSNNIFAHSFHEQSMLGVSFFYQLAFCNTLNVCHRQTTPEITVSTTLLFDYYDDI